MLVTTSANINDVTQARALLYGEEMDVFGDAGYRGCEQVRREPEHLPWPGMWPCGLARRWLLPVRAQVEFAAG